MTNLSPSCFDIYFFPDKHWNFHFEQSNQLMLKSQGVGSAKRASYGLFLAGWLLWVPLFGHGGGSMYSQGDTAVRRGMR